MADQQPEQQEQDPDAGMTECADCVIVGGACWRHQQGRLQETRQCERCADDTDAEGNCLGYCAESREPKPQTGAAQFVHPSEFRGVLADCQACRTTPCSCHEVQLQESGKRKGGQMPIRIDAKGELLEACEDLRNHLVQLVGVYDGLDDTERANPSPHLRFVLAYDEARRVGAIT